MSYTLEMHETFSTPLSAKQSFDYIVDFSHIDDWDHTIVSSHKVGGSPIGLGTCFELIFAMGKRKSPISYEITEFVSPTKAVLTGNSKRFTAVDSVSIEALDHGCRVDWHASIVFTGLSAFIVPLLAKKIKTDGAQTISQLNAVLNAQATAQDTG